MQALASRQSSALPFLAFALRRLLQEYPWVGDGLSRSERQILRAVDAGAGQKTKIYIEASKEEDVPWGDESVYFRMNQLASGKRPALQCVDENEIVLTGEGKALLDGKADWVELAGGIDRWLGGVHLVEAKAPWRWDGKAQKLRRD